MFQEAATEASGRYAGSRMNSFVGYKLDPESEQEEIGFLNAAFNGIIDTYGDWSSYEAGFAGLFMGAVGSPNFTFTRSADGSRSVMDGGVWQDIRETRSQTQDLQAAADAINNRMKDPT